MLVLPRIGGRPVRVEPVTFNAARAYLRRIHRHLGPPRGWLFGVRILDDYGELVGVACAGRPKAKALQDGFTAEITRVATEGFPNACSFAYGALRRAASALGYRRVYTYTRQDEPGSSVMAAGFVRDADTDGGGWSRPSRERGKPDDDTPKVRWVWPASARQKEAPREPG